MKKAHWALIVAAGLSLSGCAAKEAQQPKEEPVVQTTEADAILACVAENRKFSRQEFNRVYKTDLAKATQPGSAELSPLICLSLHQQATYKQFKAATEVLVRYTASGKRSQSPGIGPTAAADRPGKDR